MAVLQIARPFTWNGGTKPHLRYGVGCYDIPDPVAAHWYVQWHTQAAVLARGGALIQHRDPIVTGWAGANCYADGMGVVSSIEPQPIDIWSWPPGYAGAAFIEGLIEPAPGAMVARMVEIEPGHFDLRLEPAPYHVPHRRFSSPMPVPGITPPVLRPPSDPRINDIWVPGVQPGSPPIDPMIASIPTSLTRVDPVARFQAMAASGDIWSPRDELMPQVTETFAMDG
jgi:hypothetical protein